MQPCLESQTVINLLFNKNKLMDETKSINVSKLISIMHRNRIPVATLAVHPYVINLSNNPDFSKYLDSEKRRMDYVTSAYGEIYKVWIENGIQSVVIKSPGYFPYLSDNLDLLVHEDAFGMAENILFELGYIELPHMREPYKKLYRKIQGSHFTFPIHLHTRVAWINSFLTDEEIFQGIRLASGEISYLYPSPENCILINLAHWFYEDKSIRLCDIYNLDLQFTNEVDLQLIWERVYLGGWVNGFQSALEISNIICGKLGIKANFATALMPYHQNHPWYLRYYHNFVKRQQDICLPWKLPKPMCKVMQFQKSIYSKNQHLTMKIHDIWLLLKYMLIVKFGYLRRSPSFIVSISGVDGSGKSTLANNITNQLQSTFSFHAEHHWGRVASSTILEIFKLPYKLFSKLKTYTCYPNDPSKSITAQTTGKVLLSNHPKLRMFWGGILCIEYIIRLWILITWIKIKGGIHVFDRYVFDASVDLSTIYNFPYSEWIINCLPKPNFSIYLSIDEQIALQRSVTPVSEENLISSLKKFEAYRKNFSVVISGQQSIHTITTEAIGYILRNYNNVSSG